jgi:hypothetical protein
MSLPDFLVIGAPRAGTTSLWHHLDSHPQVYMSPVKEPKFFAFEGEEADFRGPPPEDLSGGTGAPWAITDLEAYRALFGGVTDETAVGEASTLYLYYNEKTAERIRRRVPEAKLIAVLRDPAERAYSHFLFMRSHGREPLADFARALDAEEERVRERWWPAFHYTRAGFYHEQLSRYFELFGREQIRIYLYEDLKTDPSGVTRDVFRFLGVDDAFVPDGMSVRHNPSGIPKSSSLYAFLYSGFRRARPFVEPHLPKGLRHRVPRLVASLKTRNLDKPRLLPEVRGRLIGEYREDVLRLQDLIGRDLSSWLEQQ